LKDAGLTEEEKETAKADRLRKAETVAAEAANKEKMWKAKEAAEIARAEKAEALKKA